MSNIREIEGNLITLSKNYEFDIIGHGNNCKKNWGAGIALSMKKAYPKAYQVDLNSNPRLGEYSLCEDYDECKILNIYTQIYPGRNRHGKDSDYNRYQAIDNVMSVINENFKDNHIGLPFIGGGLAGLKWSKVKGIIKSNLTDMDITFVKFKP